MKYIPTPAPVQYRVLYSAIANKSGRMQYFKIFPGKSKTRIGRNDFIDAYNSIPIIALRPLPEKELSGVFQFEFYT